MARKKVVKEESLKDEIKKQFDKAVKEIMERERKSIVMVNCHVCGRPITISLAEYLSFFEVGDPVVHKQCRMM